MLQELERKIILNNDSISAEIIQRLYFSQYYTFAYLYVASAVYAEHAGNADTASNALKLGGYDASDYLRKDEVQTVTAAYQEIEWTTPGTYNWIVPEGVNSILVTTVGGGGGYGFKRYYNKANQRYLIFTGGAGGEVIVNKLVKTSPGETLQIIVGQAGNNVAGTNGSANFDEATINAQTGKSGGAGGISYIARNGTMISDTKARGGRGGAGQWSSPRWSCVWVGGPSGYCSYHNWYHINDSTSSTSTTYGGYNGGTIYYGDGWSDGKNTPSSEHINRAKNGYSGKGGFNEYAVTTVPTGYWSTTNPSYFRASGTYYNTSGGGSWGDGGSDDMYATGRAGLGGGGTHISCYGGIQPGYGMVRILAIGVSYDE